MQTFTEIRARTSFLVMMGFSFHLVIITFVGWFASIDALVPPNEATGKPGVFSNLQGGIFPLVFFITAFLVLRRKHERPLVLTTTWLVIPSITILCGMLVKQGLFLHLPLVGGSISAILIGIGIAGNCLLYQWVLFAENAIDGKGVTLEVIGGTGVAALLYYLISWLMPLAIFVLVMVVFIPGACFSLIWYKKCGPQDISEPLSSVYQSAGLSKRLKDAFHSMAVPTLCIALFSLIWGVLRVLAIQENHVDLVNNLATFGRFFSAGALLVIFLINGFKIHVSVFYRWALPILGTAFFVFPLFSWGFIYGLVPLSYFLFSVASVVAILAYNQVAYYYRIAPFVTYGLGFGTIYLFNYFGITVAKLVVSHTGVETTTEKMLLSFVVLYAILMVFVLSSRFERRTSVGSWSSDKLAAIDTVSTIRSKTCEIIASRYGLTDKEKEVLGHLALGEGASFIAATMVVSENTIYFHTRNIYRKLAIHSKRELFELFEKLGKE